MGIVIKFITGFMMKYLTAFAIEEAIIILLGYLVNSTKSRMDNDLYEVIFKKIRKE